MDRNYFIGTEPSGNSGGSKFDIMAFLPSLMGGGGKSLDPNLVAALMNNKGNQDAWGGGGCWWIWIILLFFVWGGFGNNGFGNNNGANGLPAQLNNDAGRELLMNAIQGNGTAIGQLSSSLNCSTQQLQNAICQIQGQIQGVGNQVGMSSQQIINAIQSGNNQLLTQIAQCCCDVRTSIERQGAETRLQNCQDMSQINANFNSQTHAIVESQRTGNAAIIAKLDAMEARHCQEKIDALTAEKLALQGQISQANQNAYFAATIQAQTAPIVNRLNALQGDVDGIKCKMPPTVAVPYPQLQAFNPEIARAAAYGAYAGDMAAYNGGCGCGC